MNIKLIYISHYIYNINQACKSWYYRYIILFIRSRLYNYKLGLVTRCAYRMLLKNFDVNTTINT